MFRGQDAWRKLPILAGCWKQPLPGLGTAIVIFTAYCIVEAGYKYVTGIIVTSEGVSHSIFAAASSTSRWTSQNTSFNFSLGDSIAYSVYQLQYSTVLPVSAPRSTMTFDTTGSFGDNMPTGEKKGGHGHGH